MQQAERNDCLTANEGGMSIDETGRKRRKEAETKPNNRRPACGYMKKEVLGEKREGNFMRRQFHRWSAWLFDIVSPAGLGRLTAPRLAPSATPPGSAVERLFMQLHGAWRGLDCDSLSDCAYHCRVLGSPTGDKQGGESWTKQGRNGSRGLSQSRDGRTCQRFPSETARATPSQLL